MITQELKKATAALLAAALVLPQGALAADAAAAAGAPADANTPVYQGVEVSDDFVAVKLSGRVQYNSFLTQTPPRLILDLLDVKHGQVAHAAKGSGKLLVGVRSSQYQRDPRLITRVVLDLSKTTGYKVGALPDGLGIQLIDGGTDAAAPAAAATPAAAPTAQAAAAPASAASAAPAAAAKTAPAASAAAAMEPPPAWRVPTRPIVAATSTKLAVEAPPPPTPEKFSAAAAFKRAGLQGRYHSELAATAEYEDVAKDAIDLPASVEPGHDSAHRLGGKIFYDLISRLPKDKVTLDFDSTDVRDVIKLLAAKSRINIIYGSDVNGSLTLHLAEVPFDEAFRTVLSMMQLTTTQVGSNVLRVITPSELIKQRATGGAVTKVVPLNYAVPADVKKAIDSVRLAEGRTGSSSIDAKTNSIIITETLEGLLATENLIRQLDDRPKQVLIDAKLVEVNANTSFDYGVTWNELSLENNSIGGKAGTTVTGSPIGFPSTTGNFGSGNAIFTSPFGTSGGQVPTGGAPGGTGVNLPADNIFGALTLGRITNNYLINATLTAAAAEGKAKVLSDPKIATLNNQAANISVTTQHPYATANVSSTGVATQTVSYVTTGIQLTVTPSINADGRIQLTIQPNISQPSATAATNTQTGAVGVDSRTANTTVLVRDGETVVIGGLISDTVSDTISKVPFLGDIPVIGWLFKKKSTARTRTELLIFVTTRVMAD